MIKANIRAQRGEFSLDIQLDCPENGVIGVYGPSGSGKTSFLRSLAGLEACQGSIQVGSQSWLEGDEFSLAVDKRQVAYVFQEPSLFAHLSVQQNLLYGVKRRAHNPISNINLLAEDVEYREIISFLKLGRLLRRKPDGLSGGEKQRVAIARALLSHPKVLLMDEPLAAVDERARKEILSTLAQLLKKLSIPVVYVSHSSAEIAQLSDYLMVIEEGKVSAFGKLESVLSALDSPFANTSSHAAATGLQAFSVLNCWVEPAEPEFAGLSILKSSGGAKILIPEINAKPGQSLRLKVPANEVSLSLERPDKTSIINILKANINAIGEEDSSRNRLLRLGVSGDSLLTRISNYSFQQLELSEGQEVYAQFKSSALDGLPS